jgi:SpoVK/Ycf46/Vps4 family AAA+-type ATPase
MNDIERLERLIRGGNACISIVTQEEHQALEVIRRAAERLDWKMRIWSLGKGTRDGLLPLFNGSPKNAHPESAMKEFCALPAKHICVALDMGPVLSSRSIFRGLRDTIHRMEINRNVLILIESADGLPEVIKAYCRPFELSLPTEKELENLIRNTLREIHDKSPVEIGLTRAGLDAIIRNLRGLSIRQAYRLLHEIVLEDQRFRDEDVNKIITGKRQMIESDGLLEFVQVPMTMDEIGGMARLKHWLDIRQKAFTPEAQDFGLRAPRGVLILGIQGGGKSLCAKAIATAWKQPLFRLDCGALYNSYVGESERNLRRALRQIEAMSPAILWIDEIEKAFASAASQSTDGGLSKRMFATLLTWMQEHREAVFLVATANDIEALPPELLRKGRFDEIFFVSLPDPEVRKDIFRIHLKKRRQDPGQFDLKALAELAEGFSGSEIEQAVLAALHEAFNAGRPLDTRTLAAVIRSSPPLSVTMRERMNALCQWAQGRCVPAD